MVWVRMLKRPQVQPGSMLLLRNKFNSILEERLLDGNVDSHHIISITVNQEEFDLQGNLTSAGKLEFWCEVDRGLKNFDLDQIKLKPRVFHQKQLPTNAGVGRVGHISPIKKRKSNPTGESCRKLPTPPPAKVMKSDRDHRDHHHCRYDSYAHRDRADKLRHERDDHCSRNGNSSSKAKRHLDF